MLNASYGLAWVPQGGFLDPLYSRCKGNLSGKLVGYFIPRIVPDVQNEARKKREVGFKS